MRYRAADPYVTTARFASKCQCGDPIHKGDRIFYYPNNRSALLLDQACKCGEKAQAEFDAARFDESMGG